MILAFSYRDKMGAYHGYEEIEFKDGKAFLKTTGEELSPMVEKMSKSKKNVINPDDILSQYGADAFRMYEMFMGPFEASKPWDMKGIEGIARFLRRIMAWNDSVKLTTASNPKEIEILTNKTIAKVTEDIETFHFNTAISALMVMFNDISKLETVSQDTFDTFLKLLHPFAPHLSEEIWQTSGHGGFLVKQPWPKADKSLIGQETVEVAIQVNGKVRDRIKIVASASKKEMEEAALASEKIKKNLEGMEIKKIIAVPARIVSIIAAPKK